MPKYTPLPGFRDFYPDDLALRAAIVRVWKEVARRYGFVEYDGPPLEPLELYTDKSGPEIVQQLYCFTDKGGREVALRPEMTPTLARMVGARAGGMRKPIKWFAVPQLFRYERQQRGRLREHFQLNLDIVGEAGIAADAELLAAAIDTLRGFGLTHEDFVARISDRRLLRQLLLHAGVPEDQLALAYNIVDKLERDPREHLLARLRQEVGLNEAAAAAALDLFRHNDFDAACAAFGGVAGADDELRQMADLFRRLRAMGLGEYVRFDLSVVRGLAYYTGVVWELFDRRGELRAIAGGGRYDGLLRQVGGTDLPALGFGMGDVVLRELLADRGLLPPVPQGVDYFLVAVTVAEEEHVLRLAHALREAGHSAEYALRPQPVGKQFKHASAVGAAHVVVVGPEEREAACAVVKTMETGEERRVSFAALATGRSPV